MSNSLQILRRFAIATMKIEGADATIRLSTLVEIIDSLDTEGEK